MHNPMNRMGADHQLPDAGVNRVLATQKETSARSEVVTANQETAPRSMMRYFIIVERSYRDVPEPEMNRQSFFSVQISFFLPAIFEIARPHGIP
jgi:hypothetical protein